MMRSNVDLPQPDGPTSEMNSPSSIVRSTPFKTSAPSKALRRARISISAISIRYPSERYRIS